MNPWRALLLAVVATAAFPGTAAAQEPDGVPGEVIVRFDAGVAATARSDVRRDAGVSAVRSSRLPGVQLVKVRTGQTVRAAIRALEADPSVRYAEPNFIYRASAIPNDTDFAQLHGLSNANDTDIDAPEAWDLTTGSANEVVAVVDSGIAYDHQDLAGNIWNNPGEIANGADDDGNGLVDDLHGYDFVDAGDADPRDVNGHGSHVAGTIGAEGNNALGITGVNWDVSLMAVRVLGASGSGNTLDIAEGFDYAADEGARIVNASLGGPGGSQTMGDVVTAHPNTLYVVAAGNEAANNEATPSFPCNLPQLNVICVAATTVTDGLASFSNIGVKTVDLGAPGTDIRSSVPHTLTAFQEDFETDPFAARWVNDPFVPWSWVDNGAGNHFIDDSPGTEYAPNTNTSVTTATAIPNSGIGCMVGFLTRLDAEEGFDGLFLETSPTGTAPWTVQDGWTGTFTDAVDAGIDAAGTDVFIRFRFVSDDIVQQDGVLLDDIQADCVHAGASNDYANFQGTSMASPHVAGVAALVLALRPTLTVSQLRDVLLSSGDPLAALAGETVTGRRLNAFGALQPPPSRSPSTGTATAITTTSAILNGAVDPLGTETSFQFEYGTTTAYGSATTAASAGAGVGAQAVAGAVNGLAPGTTYHYRAVWIRGSERAFGADGTVTTTATPPPPAPASPPSSPPALTLNDVRVAGCRQRGRGARTRLRCALVQADALTSARLTLSTRTRRIARGTSEPSSTDTVSLKLKRRLKSGRYTLTLKLSDAAGKTRTVRFRFRVR
jgi:subtilisin family serine protease